MTPDDRIEKLLTDILDTQRASLEEYKRVTAQSLEVQRRSVDMQTSHVRLYKRFVLWGGVVMALLVAAAAWLLRLIGTY